MPRTTGASICHTLRDFVNDFEAPTLRTFNRAPNQTADNTLFKHFLWDYNIQYHISSPYRPNENPYTDMIREIKMRWYRIMTKINVPPRLWDFGYIWICEAGNLSVSSSRYAKGHTPKEIIRGKTPDISEYTDFSFYDWVTFKQDAGLSEVYIGRWLEVSHKI